MDNVNSRADKALIIAAIRATKKRLWNSLTVPSMSRIAELEESDVLCAGAGAKTMAVIRYRMSIADTSFASYSDERKIESLDNAIMIVRRHGLIVSSPLSFNKVNVQASNQDTSSI
jgi:hypothetical protein